MHIFWSLIQQTPRRTWVCAFVASIVPTLVLVGFWRLDMAITWALLVACALLFAVVYMPLAIAACFVWGDAGGEITSFTGDHIDGD